MITLQELCTYLNELLSPQLFSDFCTNGLQVEGKNGVKTIATAVSASLNTIQQAAKLQADVLLVHHGLFWSRDSHDIKGITKDKLKILLENDISLIAYHLPLDAHRELGNNWLAAKEMGWKNLEPFPKNEKQPIGVKGTLENVSHEEFLTKLKSYYKNPTESVAGTENSITTAALVSGGAHKMILDAAKEGIDCFITGSRDEPTWHQAYENKMHFFAVGHSASEVIGIKALGEHISKRFGIPCHFIEEPNPF